MTTTPYDKSIALFLFGYGSEVRQFIYSGFVDELKKHYQVVVAARVVTDNLMQLAEEHEFKLVELVHAEPNRIQKFLFGKADAVFTRAYYQKKKFSYFGRSQTIGKPVKFSGLYRCLLPGINVLEQAAFYCLRDRRLDRFLAEINPGLLIVNLPRSSYFLRLIFQVKRLRTKTCLIFNTLKEIDANGRINIPIDQYFTWNSESSQELLRYNQHIVPQNIHAVGSTYYDISPAARVATDSRHLLYCAANPKSIPNEVAFVERLVHSLKSAGLLENLAFVIRPNPMDGDFSRWDGLSRIVGVKVEVPKWIWRAGENWNEALVDDVETYQRLMKEARFVIGSASTVAIDAVVAGKIFLCIADNFWPETFTGCDFSYFSEAENFKLVRQSQAVICVSTFEGMVRVMQIKTGNGFFSAAMPAVITEGEMTASQKIIKEFLRG